MTMATAAVSARPVATAGSVRARHQRARRVRLDGMLDGLSGSGRCALRGSEAVERQADQEAGGESDQEEDEDRHLWGARGGRSPPEVSPGGRLEKPAA